MGAIDEKYDIAMSTACGPLDNVVVDSIDDAQACVEFLKRNNIGQATFIGLDKVSPISAFFGRLSFLAYYLPDGEIQAPDGTKD